MQANVKSCDMATYPNGRYDMRDFTGMGVEAATDHDGESLACHSARSCFKIVLRCNLRMNN
jgi:hypothetical protein